MSDYGLLRELLELRETQLDTALEAASSPYSDELYLIEGIDTIIDILYDGTDTTFHPAENE